MRKTLMTISLLALLLAACGTSQPGKPSPTVLGTQAPAAAPTIEVTEPPTEPPAQATSAPAPQAPAPTAPPAAPAPTAPPMQVYKPPPTPHY